MYNIHINIKYTNYVYVCVVHTISKSEFGIISCCFLWNKLNGYVKLVYRFFCPKEVSCRNEVMFSSCCNKFWNTNCPLLAFVIKLKCKTSAIFT